MQAQYVARAETSGSPWLVLEGDEATRLAKAQTFIDTTFGRAD